MTASRASGPTPMSTATADVTAMIERMQAVLDASTPGEWRQDGTNPSHTSYVAAVSDGSPIASTHAADAAFITAVHNSLPPLLTLLAAVVAERDEMRALTAAHQAGWRSRIELGDIDYDSDDDLDRWNASFGSNPHTWNTDLYNNWRRGWMDNDLVRLFNALGDEFAAYRMTHRTLDVSAAGTTTGTRGERGTEADDELR